LPLEVIEKSGTWFSYDGERLGQGRENARNFLIENSEIMEKLILEIYEKSGLSKRPDTREED
jgi:recombination protein RecA